ncbi:MAG: hypothetical protein R3F22_09525 [Lysobacteraceae bacterium]
MKASSYWLAAIAALFLFTMPGARAADADGQVIVRVETVPATGNRTLVFDGEPSGSLTLDNDGRGSLVMGVAVGSHESTLARIDQRLLDAGYRLVNIQCNDVASASRSDGDLQNRRANFAVDPGETVTCTFQLGIDMACICPKEGRWRVNNHVGSMICSGAFSMNVPLPADRDTGKLTVNSDCSTVHGDSLGDDEADIDMQLQPDCSWKGSVGGERDGIPMTIHFRWNAESETRITGDLYSNVSQQGMTCNMKRTYELDFEG